MRLNPVQRPSQPLLVPACAPLASWLPSTGAPVVAAAERSPLSQVHQVQIQAELALELVAAGVGGNGTNGTTSTNGFYGDSDGMSGKRGTDGASGVPPRGRPV